MRNLLLICDIQTKTLKNLYNKSKIIKNINLLLDQDKLFNYIVSSELCPQKLGHTSNELNLSKIDLYYSRSNYSMVDHNLLNILDNIQPQRIILCGMELQWCIYQTVRDLSLLNYNIIVPYDATGNKYSNTENYFNFKQIEKFGAEITSTENYISRNLTNFYDNESKNYVQSLKKYN